MNELYLLMADLDLRIFDNWVVEDSKEIPENSIEIVSPSAYFMNSYSLPRLPYAPRYSELL